MEECSLDLIFFKLGTDHLLSVGGGAVFSDKMKAFIFCKHEKSFYNYAC